MPAPARRGPAHLVPGVTFLVISDLLPARAAWARTLSDPTRGGFDRFGNVTGWGSGQDAFQASWDALNQLRSPAGLGVNRRLAYDAHGERILLREVNLSPVVYTLTLRDLGGKVVREVSYTPSTGSWAWRKDYVWRDGHLLASVSASEGLRHYHLDYLGSPRLLTDRCGERMASWQPWPFGLDPQGQPGGGGQHGERMRFTGHERDLHLTDRAGDDLDSMHPRYYSPLLARFVRIDPGRDNDLRAPQSWNLYGYVRNSPVNLSDPSGQRSLGQFLFDVLSGRLFEEWFKKKVDEQTKPKTQRTKEEQEEQEELLREAGLDPSNQGKMLGTGGEELRKAASDAHGEIGGKVGGEFVTVATARVIRFGGGVVADSRVFHRVIKPRILHAAGDYERVVGRNPDVKVVGGMIQLAGTGPFRGKTYKTALRAADFF